MAETGNEAPFDLASLDGLMGETVPATPTASLTAPSSLTAVTPNKALEREAPLPRLVDVANMSVEELAAANRSAEKVDFRKTASLLAHGDNVLAEIAQSSRQLLTGVRLGDAGEVGRIAAAVIDGVKILRIQDLQAESNGEKNAAPRKGLVGKLLDFAADAHTAFKEFQENRKQFFRSDGCGASQSTRHESRPWRHH